MHFNREGDRRKTVEGKGGENRLKKKAGEHHEKLGLHISLDKLSSISLR